MIAEHDEKYHKCPFHVACSQFESLKDKVIMQIQEASWKHSHLPSNILFLFFLLTM